jgi:hypothetical protein
LVSGLPPGIISNLGNFLNISQFLISLQLQEDCCNPIVVF